MTEQKTISIVSCDKASLVDLNNIHIDTGQPTIARLAEFAEQVKNPYLFKVGDIAVNVIYHGDKSLSNVLANVLKAS